MKEQRPVTVIDSIFIAVLVGLAMVLAIGFWSTAWTDHQRITTIWNERATNGSH